MGTRARGAPRVRSFQPRGRHGLHAMQRRVSEHGRHQRRRLWVATQQGIAMLEFSRLRHTERKPAIFIERIVIGKTVRAPGRELTLPAGTHRVELHFDTVELASPEAIRLQYRLDDVDREWLDADSSSRVLGSRFVETSCIRRFRLPTYTSLFALRLSE